MTARLHVDVRLASGGFPLAAAFASRALVTGLFGPSGSGKTTLLETIAGLRRGAEGMLSFGGETWLDSARSIDRPPEARGVGWVPQDGRLFPHWDTRGNILAGRARAARGGSHAAEFDHVVDLLDLAPLLDRRVEALSGGERQRVALARALCSGPSLLLLDEPLASIDAPLRGKILRYLIRVRDDLRLPTVYVSHDPADMIALCGEVAVLDRGSVVRCGPPPEVFLPREGSDAGIASDFENVLEGAVVEAAGGRVRVELPGGIPLVFAGGEEAAGAAPGARVLVAIRASEILIAVREIEGLSARNVWPGSIRSMAAIPGGWVATVAVGPGIPPLSVAVTDAARAALGLREGVGVRLLAKARSCRLLAVR